MNKKFIAITLLLSALILLILSLFVYIGLLNDMDSGRSTSIDSGQALETLSYAVSYVTEPEKYDPVLVDSTKDWSEYTFKGVKLKYPHEELLPEEPQGPIVNFKNLVNKDFTNGMTLHVYNAKGYPSSMNFLENFILTERGVIKHDIHQIVRIGEYDVAQLGYYEFVHEGFYGLEYGLKLGDKGIVIGYAFETEKKYEDLNDFNMDKGHVLINQIVQTLELQNSLTETDTEFYLDAPDTEFLELYKQYNKDNPITL